MTTGTTTLETPYALAARDLDHFDRHGHVTLRGALSPEILAGIEPDITAKLVELNTMHLPLAERPTYHKAFLQVTNLWRHGERIRELVFSARLASMAARLLDVGAVRLYHDQALYKEPGGGITPWHADQYYWPFSSDRCCTAWIPLQDTPPDMGPLAFASGSHRLDIGRNLQIGDESEAAMQDALGRGGFPLAEQPYALGDVSFHRGWTFHRATPNTSTTPRRVMTVIYLDADMVISEPANPNQEADLARFLPGVRPGGIADTPLNPVLYPPGRA